MNIVRKVVSTHNPLGVGWGNLTVVTIIRLSTWSEYWKLCTLIKTLENTFEEDTA